MKVWIDQDLCTGDGLCEEIAPAVFTLLDDGLAYVKEADDVKNEPGGSAGHGARSRRPRGRRGGGVRGVPGGVHLHRAGLGPPLPPRQPPGNASRPVSSHPRQRRAEHVGHVPAVPSCGPSPLDHGYSVRSGLRSAWRPRASDGFGRRSSLQAIGGGRW